MYDHELGEGGGGTERGEGGRGGTERGEERDRTNHLEKVFSVLSTCKCWAARVYSRYEIEINTYCTCTANLLATYGVDSHVGQLSCCWRGQGSPGCAKYLRMSTYKYIRTSVCVCVCVCVPMRDESSLMQL